MTLEFHVEPDPSQELIAQVSSLAPANPFYTSHYAAAMRALNFQPLILSLRRDRRVVSACTAFMKSGRLNTSVEITSLPLLEDGNAFWKGLFDFCQKAKISHLMVSSFASEKAVIPSLQNAMRRTTRSEFVINLQETDIWKGMRKGHRWSVTRGRKAGLEVRRSATVEDGRIHAEMMKASMERRKARGEAVPEEVQLQACVALLQQGAGELFQAVRNGKVVSSALVVMAPKGAYYQSAGTSRAGMDCGASTFLLYEIARTLQGEGKELFNLGGVDQQSSSLREFKLGFGVAEVGLEAAEFFLGSRIRRKLGTAARLIRENPLQFLRYVAGRLERFVVYTAEAKNISPPEPIDGLALEKLKDDALANLPVERSELRAQVERFHRLGFNDAYAVYKDGELAHISWLITPEHDRLGPIRNVKLRSGEAEITHCVTLPEFRGNGVYPFAIRSLCQIAAARGLERIFMITSTENIASQRGMEKAGLSLRGKIMRLVLPYLPGEFSLTYRGHRAGQYGPRSRRTT